MLRAFKVDQEPGYRAQSLGDSADSDTSIYRTFSFRAVSEQRSSVAGNMIFMPLVGHVCFIDQPLDNGPSSLRLTDSKLALNSRN